MNWKKISFWMMSVVILISPWIIGVAINNVPNFGSVGSQSDWLSFWGSYAGSIIAFGGIYWQVNKQREQSKEELLKHEEFERALVIENARPHLVMGSKYFYSKISKSQLFENRILAKKSVKEKVIEQIEKKEPYHIIYVKNESENVAYHCSLLIEGLLLAENSKEFEMFRELEKIGTLGSNEGVHILPDFLKKYINVKPEYLSVTFKFTSSKNETGYYFQNIDLHKFVKDRSSVQAYKNDEMIDSEEEKNLEINIFMKSLDD